MLRTKPRPKRERDETFANHVPRARRAAPCRDEFREALAGIAALDLRPIAPKTPERKSQAIRDSANGEQCLVRLPGCIGHAIWSHNRHGRAGKGGGIKALDLNGCYCCVECDKCYDGQKPRPEFLTRDEVELAWYHAHAESLCKLAQKGLLK